MQEAVIVTPGGAGGVERFCDLLALVLVDEGWDVKLMTAVSSHGRWAARLGLTNLLRSHRTARQLRTQRTPDLIVTNGHLGGPWFQADHRIHVYHGTMPGTEWWGDVNRPWHQRFRSALGGGVAEWFGGLGAIRVAVSGPTAREVRRFLCLHVDKVIENGVDTARFRGQERLESRRALGLSPEDAIALFVGRWSVAKGADVALLAARLSGWKLVVAGPDRPPSEVTYIGNLTPDRLAFAYSAADALLFPSRYEACAYVPLEAGACGLPVVAPPVGVLRDIPRDPRLVMQNADPAGYAKALHEVSAGLTSDLLFTEAVLKHYSLDTFRHHWRSLVRSIPTQSGNKNPKRR